MKKLENYTLKTIIRIIENFKENISIDRNSRIIGISYHTLHNFMRTLERHGFVEISKEGRSCMVKYTDTGKVFKKNVFILKKLMELEKLIVR